LNFDKINLIEMLAKILDLMTDVSSLMRICGVVLVIGASLLAFSHLAVSGADAWLTA
jgi:hypothetical protein